MTAIFEPFLRWPGAPRTCLHANLPAFDTLAAMNTFFEKNGPSCKKVRAWKCGACGKYHMETKPPGKDYASASV